MKKTIFFVMLISSLFFAVNHAAAEKKEIFLTAECTSKGTDWDGSRNSCRSKEQCQNVPSGYVINEKSLKVRCTSCAGSENDCNYSFGDSVEVISGTGITQPTKLCVSAHARSPKHKHGARGWSKCEYKAEYVKYVSD